MRNTNWICNAVVTESLFPTHVLLYLLSIGIKDVSRLLVRNYARYYRGKKCEPNFWVIPRNPTQLPDIALQEEDTIQVYEVTGHNILVDIIKFIWNCNCRMRNNFNRK